MECERCHWISVKDRLPGINIEKVIVYYDSGKIAIARFVVTPVSYFFRIQEDSTGNDTCSPDYWAELPYFKDDIEIKIPYKYACEIAYRLTGCYCSEIYASSRGQKKLILEYAMSIPKNCEHKDCMAHCRNKDK